MRQTRKNRDAPEEFCDSSILTTTRTASASVSAILEDIGQNHFEGDLLEGELIAGTGQETERNLVRLIFAAKLDLHRAADILGKRFGHLAIQDEGGISVELFLELIKLCVATGPGTRLIHRQHKRAPATVKNKRVEHVRMRNAFGSYVFGNHLQSIK